MPAIPSDSRGYAEEKPLRCKSAIFFIITFALRKTVSVIVRLACFVLLPKYGFVVSDRPDTLELAYSDLLTLVFSLMPLPTS
jgi:hypothetical protein